LDICQRVDSGQSFVLSFKKTYIHRDHQYQRHRESKTFPVKEDVVALFRHGCLMVMKDVKRLNGLRSAALTMVDDKTKDKTKKKVSCVSPPSEDTAALKLPKLKFQNRWL
jgi:hypothetical protein